MRLRPFGITGEFEVRWIPAEKWGTNPAGGVNFRGDHAESSGRKTVAEVGRFTYKKR